MVEPNFEFYVLRYDFNRKEIVNFNIFDNNHVYDTTLKEVKKYCRAPSKYLYKPFYKPDLNGFEGLCKAIETALLDEWARVEYEIIVDSVFGDIQEKWDCYHQALPNIEIIARECIYQYKKSVKEKKYEEK